MARARRILLGLLVLVGNAAGLPPGRAQDAADGAKPDAEAAPPRVDFKVVAWFDLARPIATFQYQIYDVRKGDWTPAVDAWVAMMRERYPGYKVVVRDVDLAREPGPTETRKVGAVVHRELLAAAAEEGVFLQPGASARGTIAARPLDVPLVPVRRTWTGPYLPSIPMMFPQGAAPMGFPVPMPYPRPHP